MNDSSRLSIDRRRLLTSVAAATAGWLGSNAFDRHLQAEDLAAKAPSLKIVSVKTFELRHKLKRPFGASVSVPLAKERDALLVKIETDTGIVGWGETAPIAGARGTLEQQIVPALVGRDPMRHRQLWRELWGANFGNALAVGAVETAINDIRGKALGLPVAELFGGRLRDRVPVYVSALSYVEGSEIEEEYPKVAAEMVKKGFKAIKMRLGRHPVDREAKVAKKVRDVVGPDVKLLVDGNGAYTMGSALKMAHVLRDLDYTFFEEPLPQAPHYAGYEELRKKMPLPLAGGEVLDSRASAKELLDRKGVDIIQPDLSLCGGLAEVLAIAEMAALSGVGCIPHCWGGDILIAASLHLLSLIPDPHWGLPTDTPWLEFDQSENPWRDGLAKEKWKPEDGELAVPTKPGLGIEVDEDVVKKYAV